MAVDATNEEYSRFLGLWQVMRDTTEGEERIKQVGYLNMPPSWDKYERESYTARPAFYNATGRTVDGLSGMIFRKPPEIEFPEGMREFMEDVSLNDVSFQGFAESIVEEVLTVGRVGLLVDFPRVETGGLTQAQAERMNLRPFFSMYKAESILLPVKVGQVGNKTMLLDVRLKETVSEPIDEFEDVEVEQIRRLNLAESESGMYFRQQIYRQEDVKDERGKVIGKEWVQFGDDIIPTMNGQTLDFIPFIFFGPKDTTPHPTKPPLLDLAYVNISHFKTSADLEHAAHFTALPTPYCFGVDKENTPTSIGPNTIWTSDDKDVNVGLLEYNGQGLEGLEKRAEKKEQQMASLGARMLAPEKRQAEAAETAAIHRQGEISVLASLAQAVSIGLTKALEIARDWMGLTEDVSVQLNTDYLPSRMSAQEMTAYLQALQQGGISHEAFIEAWREGERLRSDLTTEEEMERIDTDAGGLNLQGMG